MPKACSLFDPPEGSEPARRAAFDVPRPDSSRTTCKEELVTRKGRNVVEDASVLALTSFSVMSGLAQGDSFLERKPCDPAAGCLVTPKNSMSMQPENQNYGYLAYQLLRYPFVIQFSG